MTEPERVVHPIRIDPLPPTGIVARAEAQGRTDAGNGSVDVWYFDENETLPYLELLRKQRDDELAQRTQDRRRMIDEAVRAENDRVNRERHEAAQRASDRAQVERMLEESTEFMRRALRRLDRMAARESWRRETRHLISVRREATRDQPAVRPPDDPDDEGGTDPREETFDLFEPPAPAQSMDELINVPWEGRQAPPISQRQRMVALGALWLVELPIQYLVFSSFHNDDVLGRFLSVLLTLPVALVMVLGPHLAGVVLRKRHATGRDARASWLAAFLLLPWLVLSVVLGILRTHTLITPPSNPRGGNSASFDATLERFGVTTTTMMMMFISIMLLTGGIALLLGLAHEHPYLEAFAAARAQRQEAEANFADSDPVVVEEVLAPITQDEAREREEEGDEALRRAYIDAEYAYLFGLSQGLADPAATEAIARFATRLTAARQEGRLEPSAGGPN